MKGIFYFLDMDGIGMIWQFRKGSQSFRDSLSEKELTQVGDECAELMQPGLPVCRDGLFA